VQRLILLAALAMGWSTGHAKGLGDLAPPGTVAAVVFEDPNSAADLLDGLTARLSGVPALEAAGRSLRAWSIGPAQPFARQWGPGLELEQGLAVFITEQQAVRLVFGGDRRKGLKSLVALAKAVGLPLTIQGKQLILGRNAALDCKGQAPVICQSVELMGQANVPLAFKPGARLGVYVAGKVARELFDAPPNTEVRFSLSADADGGQLVAEVKAPALAMAAGMLKPGATPTRGQRSVDARTTGVLKIGLDGPKLMGLAKQQMGGQFPEQIRGVLTALETHWSGDVWLSTAGGFSHPVLSVGLVNGGGDALLEQVVAVARQQGTRIERSGSTLVIEPPSDSDAGVKVRIQTASTADALVFALAKADAGRVARGTVQPITLPAGFADKGRHGLLFWGLPALMFGGFIPPFIDLPPKFAPIAHLQTVLSAASGLVEVIGGDAVLEPTGLTVSLWWRTL
jgi:hypothetical protein